jgi:hypothetical protein
MKRYLWAVMLSMCLGALCFGETFRQKNALFQIDVPDGWQWVEGTDAVKIVNRGGNGISIQFTTGRWSSEEEAGRALRIGNQRMIDTVVTPSGGRVLNETETKIGGVPGRVLDFVLQKGAEVGYMSYVTLINKDHAFTITFGGPKKEENLEMKKIVDSLRFL